MSGWGTPEQLAGAKAMATSMTPASNKSRGRGGGNTGSSRNSTPDRFASPSASRALDAVKYASSHHTSSVALPKAVNPHYLPGAPSPKPFVPPPRPQVTVSSSLVHQMPKETIQGSRSAVSATSTFKPVVPINAATDVMGWKQYTAAGCPPTLQTDPSSVSNTAGTYPHDTKATSGPQSAQNPVLPHLRGTGSSNVTGQSATSSTPKNEAGTMGNSSREEEKLKELGAMFPSAGLALIKGMLLASLGNIDQACTALRSMAIPENVVKPTELTQTAQIAPQPSRLIENIVPAVFDPALDMASSTQLATHHTASKTLDTKRDSICTIPVTIKAPDNNSWGGPDGASTSLTNPFSASVVRAGGSSANEAVVKSTFDAPDWAKDSITSVHVAKPSSFNIGWDDVDSPMSAPVVDVSQSIVRSDDSASVSSAGILIASTNSEWAAKTSAPAFEESVASLSENSVDGVFDGGHKRITTNFAGPAATTDGSAHLPAHNFSQKVEVREAPQPFRSSEHPTGDLIVTNWTEEDRPMKPFRPAHLAQPSHVAEWKRIARIEGITYKDLKALGVPDPIKFMEVLGIVPTSENVPIDSTAMAAINAAMKYSAQAHPGRDQPSAHIPSVVPVTTDPEYEAFLRSRIKAVSAGEAVSPSIPLDPTSLLKSLEKELLSSFAARAISSSGIDLDEAEPPKIRTRTSSLVFTGWRGSLLAPSSVAPSYEGWDSAATTPLTKAAPALLKTAIRSKAPQSDVEHYKRSLPETGNSMLGEGSKPRAAPSLTYANSSSGFASSKSVATVQPFAALSTNQPSCSGSVPNKSLGGPNASVFAKFASRKENFVENSVESLFSYENSDPNHVPEAKEKGRLITRFDA